MGTIEEKAISFMADNDNRMIVPHRSTSNLAWQTLLVLALGVFQRKSRFIFSIFSVAYSVFIEGPFILWIRSNVTDPTPATSDSV